MNILYIGAESANWILNLCNQFCEQGHNVTCVVQNLDEYDKENPVKEHENLTRINIEFRQFFNPHFVKTRLIKQLTETKFDLVFGSHAPITKVVREIGQTYNLPWGIMLLDIPTDSMAQERWRTIVWGQWFEWLKTADAVMFNTEIAREQFFNFTNQLFTDEYMVPYGINMPKKYDFVGMETEGDYLLSICRLHPKKHCSQIPIALSVFKNPPKYVAIGRDAGELNYITEISKKLDISFEHKDMVNEEEKFETIKNCSMLIYPQKTEFIGGLSPFEAMYVGKPVIVPDYKVLKDLYGEHVFYYDKTDIGLAKEISYVNNLKPEYLEDKLTKANEYCKKIATFKNMAEKMIFIFKRMQLDYARRRLE